jgi:hypothetical protein
VIGSAGSGPAQRAALPVRRAKRSAVKTAVERFPHDVKVIEVLPARLADSSVDDQAGRKQDQANRQGELRKSRRTRHLNTGRDRSRLIAVSHTRDLTFHCHG